MSNKDFIKIIPDLFEIDLNSNKSGSVIFEKLAQVLNFDEGFIYFTNPDSLHLKYTYKKHTNYKINDTFPLNPKTKKEVFDKSSKIMTNGDDFLKIIGLEKLNKKSYMLAKISIKSTVFGLILLANKEHNAYSQEDLTVLEACTGIISYVLKDMELSDVFKIQLKALKDGILEKHEAYKTIKEQNERILEADKVKNEFLANISHELRTPLNSILGFADIMSTQVYGDLNDKQKEYVEDIKVSATHLLGMINEILDMSKIEAHAMKIVKSTFPISRSITEVCNILLPLAQKKNVKLEASMQYDFDIFADYQKIQQILYNLISNAIKYSPENDQVDIVVAKDETCFRIAIHDNGIGIDPKYHGKIFAKFVQLDSAYTKKESSTGLGLTITKELVELHDGKISLISEVNNGSTFIVEIPM